MLSLLSEERGFDMALTAKARRARQDWDATILESGHVAAPSKRTKRSSGAAPTSRRVSLACPA